MLSKEEIARFHEDGCLVVDGVFSQAEVERLREAAADPGLMRDLAERGADSRCVHLLELAAKHEAFRELACDPRIAVRVAQLIGEDVQLQHSKFATKPPRKGAGAFGWHQDFAYFPHTNFDLAAVMVMLDDATPENGGMYAVRGSHKLGLLDHFRDGWFTGSCQETQHWEAHPEDVIPLMPKAGGISIHHGLTLHGSPPNHSGLPRRGVVFQYRAGDACQLADDVWADTGFQVHGQPSGRVRCAPMDLPLTRFRTKANEAGEPFGNVYRQTGAYARRWNAESPAPCAVAAAATA